MVMEKTAMTPTSSYKDEMTSYFFTRDPKNQTQGNFSVGRAGATNYIVPFQRNNRDYRDKKNLTLYLNDSTHANPSDPNSMKDQGQVRNAPYNFDIQAYQTFDNYNPNLAKTSMAQSWKGFPASVPERSSTAYVSGNIKNRDVQNQSFYRFGGTTPIRKHVDRIGGETAEAIPKLNSTFHTILSSKLKKRLAAYNESKKPKVTNYDKDPLVSVQDYTKNVSQGIFSPGANHVAMTHYKTINHSPMHKFGYRFNETEKKHERDIVKNLKQKLDRERSLRESITREVHDLKQTLNSFK